MQADELLVEVNSALKELASLEKCSGHSFNLLEILRVESNEVRMCRLLHALLDPSGAHGQGSIYLELFDRVVLSANENLSDDELASAQVFREYRTADGRRIDLVIRTTSKTGTRFVPIEVKIYAGDQENQVLDYMAFCENSYLFYLTLDGHQPAEWSRRDAADEEIICISFADEILRWIDACVDEKSTKNNTVMQEVFRQMESTVRRLTNQAEEHVVETVGKVITRDAETMQTALEIQRSYVPLMMAKMQELFDALEAGITREFGVKPIRECFGDSAKGLKFADRNQRIEKYYLRDWSSCPSIHYMIQPAVAGDEKGDIDLLLLIELWDELLFGYCEGRNVEKDIVRWEGQILGTSYYLEQGLLPKSLMLDTSATLGTPSNWILGHNWLPDGVREDSPNFRMPNQACADLFALDGVARFVERSLETLSTLPPFLTD